MKLKPYFYLLPLFYGGTAQAQTYFQQEVNYQIEVRLDDQKHQLHGFETIAYTNHSADTLKELWFHLWPNGYSNRNTAFAKQERVSKTAFHFAGKDERGWIDSLQFRVDGQAVELIPDPLNPDMVQIRLKTPILPGKQVEISTPFRVQIPSSKFSRLGHSGQQYQICQWYPKPAVYDQKGWHPMPYLNQGEFYSEFGSFEVKITVPENYVVAATGNLLSNPEEEQRILENVRRTDSLIQHGFPARDSFPPSSPTLKTLVYKQDRVHDFAWFADKRYHIVLADVLLERSGKTVYTYAYFCNKNGKEWAKAAQYAADAVKHYSDWVGDYPYDVCKVVDGALSAGAGMEYPTITIVAYPGSGKMLDRVIAHEAGHNWFYGILASNERRYPWMDEGMNSYYEKRYMAEKYPESAVFDMLNVGFLRNMIHLDELSQQSAYNLTYQFFARKNDDKVVNQPADAFVTGTYAAMIYEKAAGMMRYLAGWMGQDKFDAMMQDYYAKWKFKHPYPEDFRSIAELHSGQKLDWWFEGLLDSRKRIDYSIAGIRKKNGTVHLKIRNKGQISAPYSLTGFNKLNQPSPVSWHEGFTGKQLLKLESPLMERYSVNGTGVITDFDARNDEIKTRGICRKSGRFSLQFLSGFDTPRKNKLYYLPAIGVNMYNGFMAGAVLHNIGALRKNLEFSLMPLYGFGNQSLAGNAQVDYFIRPVGGPLKSITLNAAASRYGLARASHYDRFVTGVSFVLKNRKSNNRIKKEIIVRHIQVEYTPYLLTPTANTSAVKRSIGYNQLLFSFTDKRKLNPWEARVDIQQGDGFVKASSTIKHFFAYNSESNGLQIRLFAGTFLWKANNFTNADDVRFRLSGQTGSQDYLFDDIFIGRQEITGFWSKQMTESDGAFKVYSGRGQTLDYLIALNLKSGIIKNVPIRLFADFGHYLNAEGDRDALNYCAGAVLSFIPEAFEVYFPFMTSRQIQSTMELNPATKKYGERIRFVLNIKLANPVHILRNLEI